jgi:outer membrane protein assembly factor BamA
MEQTRHDEQNCVDIAFKCSLKHKKQLIFVGNSDFDAQRLYQLCSEFGKALLIIPNEMLVQEIRDFYTKQGYLDAEITCREDASTLIFDIKEGNKATIVSVQLDGLQELEDCSHFFSSVVHRPYDQKKINSALQQLLAYCIKQGYGNSVLCETKMHKNLDGTYGLCISLALGPRLFINAIEFTDFQDFVTQLYRQSWCKEYGCFFNGQPQSNHLKIVDMHAIIRMRKFLQKQLHDHGFLYTHVTPQFLTVDGQSVLRWSFDGKKEAVRFGDTHIKGSCDVPDVLVERACAYKKGDVWNKKKLNETATALRNFGVFDQVTVFPEDITTQEDAKTVVIQLQDSDPFELRTRVGFQGVGTNLSWRGGATYKFGGTFLWKNPRKCADIASVQLDITRFLRYAMLTYQLAFLGTWPIRQQFKLYSNRYDQPVVLGSREILYHYAQDGFLWELSQDYSGTKWGVATGINWIQTSDISKKLSEAINFTTRFIDKRIPYIFCEPSFYTSDIDNRLDPLAGWYLVLSCKALLPCGVKDAAFIKFLLEQGNYIPLHKPSHTVLALRLRLGTILYQNFSAIMPPERFYLGGAYSLRGYQPDLAPPLNFYHNNNQELIVVPTGGKTMMNMNAEVRFSLYKSLGGTLFTDIGILTQRGATDIRMGDILGASGFGLRWNTPVGPLRFDIGWKWKQFPGNQQFYDQGKYAWFLTLGNAF